MPDNSQSVFTELNEDVSQKPAKVGDPAASMTPPAGANDTAAADTKGEPKSSLHHPLFRYALSNHPPEVKVAAMRASIEAGADVNQMDGEPIVGYNEGRPLDACLNGSHMQGPLANNIPAIELLLQHGADPRLNARPTLFSPLRRARYHAENAPTEEGRAVWKRILAMIDEAILRLEDAERKTEAGKA